MKAESVYEDLSKVLKTVHDASDAEVEKMVFASGQMISGRYLVESLLGAGGMGAVYLVRDTLLGEDVKAVKIMLPKLMNDRQAQERFYREIRILQGLTHKNILRIHDCGSEGNIIFFTMEYVAGSNMRKWLQERKGKLLLPELVRIIEQVLDGLSYAHRDTIHRDIKPENILLPEDGKNVKICDFGLAQLQSKEGFVKTSHVMGTVSYMSPEQMQGRVVDARTDLFSVGVILYEALTGQMPMGRYKSVSKLRGDITAEIDAMIDRSLEFDPQDRFANAAEMRAALLALVSETGEKAIEEWVVVRSIPEPREEPQVSIDPREQERIALCAKIPEGLVEKFVKEHKGAWDYPQYQELLEELRQQIGNFAEDLFAEIVGEAKENFREQNQSSSSQEIVQQFSANLKRLEISGLITQFMQKHEGKWEEEDWLNLRKDLQQEGFYPLRDKDVQALLEKSKEQYNKAKESAIEKMEIVEALEMGHDYDRAWEILREIRSSGYWDQKLEQKEQDLRASKENFSKALATGRTLFNAGKLEESLTKLKEARKLQPRDTETNEWLAKVEAAIEIREQKCLEAIATGDSKLRQKWYLEAIAAWKKGLGGKQDNAIQERIAAANIQLEKLAKLVEGIKTIYEKQQKEWEDWGKAQQLNESIEKEYPYNSEKEQVSQWVSEIKEALKNRYRDTLKNVAHIAWEKGEFAEALSILETIPETWRNEEYTSLSQKVEEQLREQESLIQQIKSVRGKNPYETFELCVKLLNINANLAEGKEWQKEATQQIENEKRKQKQKELLAEAKTLLQQGKWAEARIILSNSHVKEKSLEKDIATVETKTNELKKIRGEMEGKSLTEMNTLAEKGKELCGAISKITINWDIPRQWQEEIIQKLKEREKQEGEEKRRRRERRNRVMIAAVVLVGIVVMGLYGMYIKSYQVSNEGVIYDKTTGLEWYVGPDKDISWDEAIKWVSDLNVAGGGWRMPTVEELRALYEPWKVKRNIDSAFQMRGWWVWSGELVDKDGENLTYINNIKNLTKLNNLNNLPFARNFSFRYGYDTWRRRSYVDRHRVFGVRSGRRR